MDPILKRFRIRITRGWAILVLLAGIVVAGAFWYEPLRPLPAELQLLAAGAEGYGVHVALDAESVRPSRTPGAVGRVPLALAVRNVGAREARPVALQLSLSAWLRLVDEHGRPLPRSRVPANPLATYTLELETVEIEPGAVMPLPGADTIWLEPSQPRYYCTFITGDVPEFVPAPVYETELLARQQLFYSFLAESTARQTGLLTLDVDPALLRRDAAPMPPTLPVMYAEPSAPRPQHGPLLEVGSRTEMCGDADQALELLIVTWETAEGGRLYVIHHGGSPRKQLYDLDGDGVIEVEMWDPDGDGDFEARRAARLPVPDILLPVGEAILAAELDAIVTDSAWLRNFYDVGAGPFRFLRPAHDTAAVAGAPAGREPAADTVRIFGQPVVRPRPDTARPDTMQRETS